VQTKSAAATKRLKIRQFAEGSLKTTDFHAAPALRRQRIPAAHEQALPSCFFVFSTFRVRIGRVSGNFKEIQQLQQRHSVT
jgi:hypothetical protein